VASYSPIDVAFDDLAHSLRRLLEAHWHAHRGGLLRVDRNEAIGNIEGALTGAFNAFHSLYDAMGKGPSRTFSWWDSGPLTTVLSIRNARHHNKANKIRTLYTHHAREAARPDRMESYILVDFRSPDPEASTFEVYLSWQDLDELLRMSPAESRLKPSSAELVRSYLRSEKFLGYSEFYHVPEASVFFNIIPIFVDAGYSVYPVLEGSLNAFSTEGEAFKATFSQGLFNLMDEPEVACGPFALPS
jgi:hypothetical protein